MKHTDCGGELESVPEYMNVYQCQQCGERLHGAANKHKDVLERLKEHDDKAIRDLATSILAYPSQRE